MRLESFDLVDPDVESIEIETSNIRATTKMVPGDSVGLKSVTKSTHCKVITF